MNAPFLNGRSSHIGTSSSEGAGQAERAAAGPPRNCANPHCKLQ
jgi:hypothetical protein